MRQGSQQVVNIRPRAGGLFSSCPSWAGASLLRVDGRLERLPPRSCKHVRQCRNLSANGSISQWRARLRTWLSIEYPAIAE